MNGDLEHRMESTYRTDVENALFTKKTLHEQPISFRLGAIFSDGMWYSLPKLKKFCMISRSEEAQWRREAQEWIASHVADGTLVASESGDSYRFPLSSVLAWYRDNGIELGTNIIKDVFPPRIWCGMTEAEGFLSAPCRAMRAVTFVCEPATCRTIKSRLRGVAKVVLTSTPGKYRALCVYPHPVKRVVMDTIAEMEPYNKERIYVPGEMHRRELVDLPDEFVEHLIMFYVPFGRVMTKSMTTIPSFLPDQDDRTSQYISWVIEAVKMYNEKKPTPFPAYLTKVLRRWPFNLPPQFLGKDLSSFQRDVHKAEERLRRRYDSDEFSDQQIADEIGMKVSEYRTWSQRLHVFRGIERAATATWPHQDNDDGSSSQFEIAASTAPVTPQRHDEDQLTVLSASVVDAALVSGCYKDALILIDQIDRPDVNERRLAGLSDEFIRAFHRAIRVHGSSRPGRIL